MEPRWLTWLMVLPSTRRGNVETGVVLMMGQAVSALNLILDI